MLVISSDFKHVFHLENDSLGYIVLKINSSLCSEISKTLRVFEIPSIFEGVMLVLVWVIVINYLFLDSTKLLDLRFGLGFPQFVYGLNTCLCQNYWIWDLMFYL